MRFGANLLRGARPIHLDGAPPGPGGPSGPGGASLGALMARHQKPLLLGGAGLVVALGVLHRRTTPAAVDGQTAQPGDPAANGATVAGYQPADTSGTDVYNALQPQIEQTQSMLQQLLGALALKPKTTTIVKTVRPKKRHHTPKKKTKRKKRHPARPSRRFSTVPPAGRAVPRRAPSPAPHKAHRDTAHVVRKGETATSIAARHGTNAIAVRRANGRFSKKPITAAGRRLVVPNRKVRRT